MCVIPTPSGCNLARREIVRDITTSPLPKKRRMLLYSLFIFLSYLFGPCISRSLLVVLHVGCFILLWCETLFVFVSPFCNEVVWLLK